ncbi:MAG: hypothetical protein AAB455_03315 [Patescibacteria group bacterium]
MEQEYRVGKPLGEAERFHLYECVLPDKTVSILKIAKTPDDNGALDREAFVLQLLQAEAVRLESKYAAVKSDPNDFLNYQLCFPNLVENLLADDQDGRRGNVVNFPQVQDDLGRLVPLSQLAEKARVRVDPKTSAWILGKLLKLLSFAHNQGISVGQLTGDNILIEQAQHYVTVFDWSQANSGHGSKVPPSIAREEISQVASAVILALGGDPETGWLPPDEQLIDDYQYAEFLHRLACGGEADANQAHEQFYGLIWSLWPREFHPFTTYQLT